MTRKRRPDCSGNVEPEKLDVLAKPKRKRRRPVGRDPAPMPERYRPAVEEAERRLYDLPIVPGVMLELDDSESGWRVTSPHDNLDAWEVQLAAAFKTRSMSVVQTFIVQLRGLCQQAFDYDNGRWKPDEIELNAAIALVNGAEPEDSLQAMHCAQMVALHWLAMLSAKQSLSNNLDLRSHATTARLMSTFSRQMDALGRAKGKLTTTRHEMTVKNEHHIHHHNHLHVEGGAEALPPQVRRLLGHAGEPAGLPTLPGASANDGDAMPIASGEG